MLELIPSLTYTPYVVAVILPPISIPAPAYDIRSPLSFIPGLPDPLFDVTLPSIYIPIPSFDVTLPPTYIPVPLLVTLSVIFTPTSLLSLEEVVMEPTDIPVLPLTITVVLSSKLSESS